MSTSSSKLMLLLLLFTGFSRRPVTSLRISGPELWLGRCFTSAPRVLVYQFFILIYSQLCTHTHAHTPSHIHTHTKTQRHTHLHTESCPSKNSHLLTAGGWRGQVDCCYTALISDLVWSLPRLRPTGSVQYVFLFEFQCARDKTTLLWRGISFIYD